MYNHKYQLIHRKTLNTNHFRIGELPNEVPLDPTDSPRVLFPDAKLYRRTFCRDFSIDASKYALSRASSTVVGIPFVISKMSMTTVMNFLAPSTSSISSAQSDAGLVSGFDRLPLGAGGGSTV